MANFCDKCGTKLEPKNRFCPACGKPVHSSEYTPAQKPAQAQNTQYPVRQPQQPEYPQHTQYTNQSRQAEPQRYNKPETQPAYKQPSIQQAQQQKPNLQKPNLQKPNLQKQPQHSQSQTLPQYGQQQSSSRQSNPQPLPQYGQQYTSNTRQHSSSGSGGLTFLIIMLAILLAAECLIACLWYPGFISPWVFPENKSTVVSGNIDELPSELSGEFASEFDVDQDDISDLFTLDDIA